MATKRSTQNPRSSAAARGKKTAKTRNRPEQLLLEEIEPRILLSAVPAPEQNPEQQQEAPAPQPESGGSETASSLADGAQGAQQEAGTATQSGIQTEEGQTVVLQIPLSQFTVERMPAGEDGAAVETAARTYEVVVIDGAIPEAARLADSLREASDRPLEIHILEAGGNPLARITQILDQTTAQGGKVSGLHLLSHATPGELQLGGWRFTGATLAEGTAGAQALAAWAPHLTEDADILLYGCDLGSGGGGLELIRSLASATGADVAASSDTTGSASLGGNWLLEIASGVIETKPLHSPLEVTLSAPIPGIVLNAPASVPIGQSFNVRVDFDNLSPTAPGYGPYIDVFIDATGKDGIVDPSNPSNFHNGDTDGLANPGDFFDGFRLTTPPAYLGASLNYSVITLDNLANGGLGVKHPYAVDQLGNAIYVRTNLSGQIEYYNAATATATVVSGTNYQSGDQLVVIELPFGSFTPDQPPAEVSFGMTLSDHADVNQPLQITAVGGFRFGADPLNNPGIDPSIIGVPQTQLVNVDVSLARLTKSYNGPENETATGPNYLRSYTINVEIANGQTFTDLHIFDDLDPRIQFVQILAASHPYTVISLPSTTVPGGKVGIKFDTPVTGGTGGSDAWVQVQFYVPRLYDSNLSNSIDSGDAPVLAPNSGADFLVNNQAYGFGLWTPIDPRDTAVVVGFEVETGTFDASNITTALATAAPDADFEHTNLEVSPLVIQKGASVHTDTGAPGATPGDTYTFTLNFQLSDYFAAGGFVVKDLIRDGLRLDPSFTPTLQINGNTYVLGASGWTLANWDVINNYSGPSVTSFGNEIVSTANFVNTFASAGSTTLNVTMDHGLVLGRTFTLNGSTYRVTASTVPATGGTGVITLATPLLANASAGDLIVDGATTLIFRVSDELITREAANDPGFAGADASDRARAAEGKLLGGGVNPSDPDGNIPNNLSLYNAGATTGVITYRAIIQDKFTDDFPSGEEALNPRDSLANTVQITANILDLDHPSNTLPPYSGPQVTWDDSGAGLTIVNDVVQKSIYAVNGNTDLTSYTDTSGNVNLSPGYQITYRFQYNIPSGDIENLRFTDFLPLPVFRVTDPNADRIFGGLSEWSFIDNLPSGTNTYLSGTPPPTGVFTYGPTHTLHTVSDPASPVPVISIDAITNSIRVQWGNFINTVNDQKKVDLLFTVTVNADPFADGLYLTNQVQSGEGNTQNPGAESLANAIIQIVINQPDVSIHKGVVASTQNGSVGTVGGLSFADLSGNGFTGTLVGAANAAAIGQLDLLTGFLPDAGDLIRFAIVAQNTGRSDAFDVRISDTIQDAYVNSYASTSAFLSGTNFRVYRGDGTLLTGAVVDAFAQVASTANLAGWSGGVITGTSNIIDGITLENGDLVLLKNQTVASENGLYLVSAVNPVLGTMTLTAVGGTPSAVSVMGGLTNGNLRFTSSGPVWTADPASATYGYHINFNTTTKKFDLVLTDTYTAGNIGGDTKTGGLSRGYNPSIDADITNGSNSVVILYDLTVDSGASAGSEVLNTAFLTRYAGEDGEKDHTADDKSEKAKVRFATPQFDKTLVGSEIVPTNAIVTAATTANIADLTNAPAVIDGVTLEIGDLVLVKDQTAAAQNGIYQVTAIGGTATLTRAAFFDSAAEIVPGYSVLVTRGSVNGGDVFNQQAVVGTLGTDPVTFAASPGLATAGARHDTVVAAATYNLPNVVYTPAGGSGGTGAIVPAPGVIDGVTLKAGDRVLLAGQTDAKQNGIYVVVPLTGFDTTASVVTSGGLNFDTSGTGTYRITPLVVDGHTLAPGELVLVNNSPLGDAFNGLFQVNTAVDLTVAAATTGALGSPFTAGGLSAGGLPGGRYFNLPTAIDGVVLAVGDLVLVKNAGSGQENGIFQVFSPAADATVRVATTGALAGAVYSTSPSNGQFTNVGTSIDGVSLAVGDRVLVKNQADAKQNGVYVVTALGTTATLTRAADFDANAEFVAGGVIGVTSGTGNGGKRFFLDTDGSIVLNTSSIAYAQVEGLALRRPAAYDTTAEMNPGGLAGFVVEVAGGSANAGLRFTTTSSSLTSAWSATAGNWTRAAIFDTPAEITANYTVRITKGSEAGSSFVLVSAPAPVINTGAINFAKASGLLERAADADQNSELPAGRTVHVLAGTNQGGRTFALTTPNAALNTSSLVFTPVAAANTASQLVPGEIATYQLRVRVPEGTTTLRITDTLDTNLAFVDVLSVTGSPGVTLDANGPTTSSNVTYNHATRTITFGNGTFQVTNADTNNSTVEYLYITYRAIALNSAANQALVAADNSATFSHDFTLISSSGAPLPQTSNTTVAGPQVTIVEPHVQIAKQVGTDGVNFYGGLQAPINLGDTIHYKIILSADGFAGAAALQSSVRVATTGSISGTFSATGGGTGGQFTGGPTSIDGVTLVIGDRVLIKDQATASQNGIYIYTAAGAFSRAPEFDVNAEGQEGAVFRVDQGTVNAGHVYRLRSDVTTINTTSVTFDRLVTTNVVAASTGQSLGTGATATTLTGLALTHGGSLVLDGVTLAAGDRVLVKDQANPAQNGIYTVTSVTSQTVATSQASVAGNNVVTLTGDLTGTITPGRFVSLPGHANPFKVTAVALVGGNTALTLDTPLAASVSSGATVQYGTATLTRAADLDANADFAVTARGLSVTATSGTTNGGRTFTLLNDDPAAVVVGTTAIQFAAGADAFDVTLNDPLPTMFGSSPVITSVTSAGVSSLRADDLEIHDAGGGSYILRTKPGVSFDLPAGTQVVIIVSGVLGGPGILPSALFVNEAAVNWTSLDGAPGERTSTVPGTEDTERTGPGSGPNNYQNLAAASASIETPVLIKHIVSSSLSTTSQPLVLADFSSTGFDTTSGTWTGQITTNAGWVTIGGSATENGSGTVNFATPVDLTNHPEIGVRVRALAANDADNLRLELVDSDGTVIRQTIALNDVNLPPGGLTFQQLAVNIATGTIQAAGSTPGFNWRQVQSVRLAGDGGTSAMRIEVDQIVALTTNAVPGEIVRYRLIVELPEANYPDLQILENIPSGMQFLNDGTARVAFVSSTTGNITSTAITGIPAIGASAYIAGNQNTLTSIDLSPASGNGFAPADNNISTSAAANADSYLNGTDVYFKLGNIVNTENDADKEYIIIEFNALVRNDENTTTTDGSLTQAGAALLNSFTAFINGSATALQVGNPTGLGAAAASASNNAFNNVIVAEPQINNLALSYDGAAPADAGDAFTIKAEFSNGAAHSQEYAPVVKVATAAALTGGTFSAGTFTGVSAPGGVLTVDGVSIAVGERILLNRASSQNQNGVYVVTQIDARTGVATLSRDTDFDSAAELSLGARVAVSHGSSAGRTFVQETTGAITVNTTNLVFAVTDAVTPFTGYSTAVRAASTGNVNTASPGASLDGITLAAGDRILLKNQSTASQNGVYIFNGASSALTRAEDFDDTAATDEFQRGRMIYVQEGFTQGGRTFAVTTGTSAGRIVQQASAYDVTLNVFLDPKAVFNSVTIQTPDGNTAALTADGAWSAGGYAGTVDVPVLLTTGNIVVTLDRLPPEIDITTAKKNITVLVSATLNGALEAGEQLNTLAQLTYTTLPGADGPAAGANPTGSVTPGAAGTAIGERDGSAYDTAPADSTPGSQTNNTHPEFSNSNRNNYAVAAQLLSITPAPAVDKSFKDGSLTDDDSSVATSPGGELVIGEQVVFDILVTLPEGVSKSVRVLDVVPAGMFLVSHQVITTAAGSARLAADFNGTVSAPVLSTPLPAGNGVSVTFDFGDITVAGDNAANNNSFVLRVVAQVANIMANQDGVFLTNEARLTYSDPDGLSNGGTPGDVTVRDSTTTSGDDTIDPGTTPFDPTIVVREPVLTLAKTLPYGDTVADAGDTITYRITITNSSAQTAYEVLLRDVLDSFLHSPALVSVTTSGFGSFPAPVAADFEFATIGPDIVLRLAAGGPLGGDLDMPAGSQIILDFTAVLSNSVSTGQPVLNRSDIFWSTVPGALDGDDTASSQQERTGGGIPSPVLSTPDPAVLNNQAVTSAVTVTAVSPIVISQQIIATSHTGTGATVETSSPQFVAATIGEFVTYKLTVSLPEGTTRNLVIDVSLPPGLAFDPSFTPFISTTAAAIPDATFLHDSHATSGLLAFNGTGISDGDPVATTRVAGTGIYGSGDDIRFRIPGPIVVTGDNDANNNTFTITYRALVLDVPGNDGLLPGLTTLTPTATFVSGAVVAATTANLAGAVFNPSGGSNGKGGFTSAPAVLDGVTLANGDLVLVKNQTIQAQNGIYLVTNAAAGTWERWDKFDDNAEVTFGYRVEVTGGTVNTGTAWTQTASGVVVNTSSIVFSSAAANAVLDDTAANGAPDAFGVTATVVEPELNIVKEISINSSPFAATATGDAGDIVTYRVTVSHTSASQASAWDLRLDDVIPSGVTGLTLVSAVISDGAGGFTDRDVIGSFLFTGNTLSTVESGPADSVNLYFGTGGALGSEQLVLIFTGTLSTTLAPGSSSQFDNDIISLTYNSLPHEVTAQQTNLIPDSASQGGSTGITSADQERHRADSDEVSITVPSFLTLAKSVIATSHTAAGGTTGNDLAIGETATFELVVTLQEGRTALLTINDATPAGLRLVPSAGGTGVFFHSPDGATAVGFNSNTLYAHGDELLAADITDATSDTSAGSLQFRFKDVTLPAASGLDTDSFSLQYVMRAANVAANQGETLPSKTNTATVLADRNGDGDHSDAGESVTSSATVVIKEPVLTLGKTTTTTGTDSGDTVVYTLTISNTGNATAYDVHILDTLDTELELVTPASALAFTGTPPTYASLDQSGNTASAVSTVLNELRPGDTVTITITARVNAGANPRDIVTNSASLTYTSLPGADSSERTGSGGVNDYTASATSSQFVLGEPSIVKAITATSDPNTGSARHNPALTDLAIGEIVTYTLTVTFTEGVTNAVTVSDFGQDNASAVLEILTAEVTAVGANLSASGGSHALTVGTTAAPSNSGGSAFNDTVSFNFGDVTNTFDNTASGADQVVITITARVANHLNNQDADTLLNTGRLVYTDGQGAVQTLDSTATVEVVEPRVTVAKSITSSTAGLAGGDTVTYEIVINNLAANGATGPAYDVSIQDVLSGGMTITAISAPSLSGGATVDTALAGIGTSTLTGVFDIPLGGSVTITYTATIPNTVTPGQSFTNDVDVFFTSQDGAVAGERAGGDVSSPTDNTPPANNAILNNYAVGDAETFTSAGYAPLVVKKIVATSEAGSHGSDVLIGEVVRYQLKFEIYEGTLNDFVIQDFLPAGLLFLNDGTASFSTLNVATTLTNSQFAAHNSLTGTGVVFAEGSDVFFKLGSLVNSDNDADVEYGVIEFNALVLNVLGNQAAVTRDNSFAVFYDTDNNAGTDPAQISTLRVDANDDGTPELTGQSVSNTVTVTITEPVLSFNQVIPAGSGYDAGDVFTITYTVSNSGSAPAYNVRLADLALPAEFDLTGISAASSGSGTSDTSATDLTADSVDAVIDVLEVGATWTVTATVKLRDSVNPGDSYTNVAEVTFTSLPGTNGTAGNGTGSDTPGVPGSATGERTGESPNVQGDGSLNDYRLTDSEGLSIGAPFSVVKTADKAVATIGEIITYTVTVTVIEGTTTNIALVDTLPAGVAFVANSAVLTAGGMTISGFNTNSASQTLTSVVNPGSNDAFASVGDTAVSSFSYSYQVVVLDVPGNDGITAAGDGTGQTNLVNSVDGSADGVPPDNDNEAAVTVVEPVLEIIKAHDDADREVYRGQVVTYTLLIQHRAGSTATAFDVNIRDLIPAGLTYIAGSVAVSGTTGSPVGVSVSNSGANITGVIAELPVGSTVTITYQARVDLTAAPGTNLDNNARIYWDSLPADDDNPKDPSDSSVPADGGDRDYGPATPGTIEAPNPAADTDPGQDTERVTVGTATISNFVWHDINGDGIQDPLEKGIPGVRVYIDLDNSGSFDPLTEPSALTDVNGEYLINGLAAGTYTVRIDTSTLPGGVTGTYTFDDTDVPGTPSATGHVTYVELSSGENEVQADFGYVGDGALGDLVWLDLDGSGTRNGLEPGIGGVTLELLRDLNGDGDAADPGEGVIATITTSAIPATLGEYLFTGLIPGYYIVRVTDTASILAGASQTYDRDNDPDYLSPVALDGRGHARITEGETDLAVDFGYRGGATLGDRVWFDVNGDGIQDSSEPGIPGVDVTLYIDVNADGELDAGDIEIDSRTTGANGLYLFEGLIAGNYLVVVDTGGPLFASFNTFDRDDVGPGTDLDSVGSEALGATENALLVDFGYNGPFSISGRSYHDLLKNSIFDGSDTGIGNVLIDLFWDTNSDGLLDAGDFLILSTTTASNGTYSFTDLLSGYYIIRENQPAGFGNSENSSNLIPVRISEVNITGQNFGNTSGSIAGMVFRDDNDNAVFDLLSTEIPIPGVTITLEWSGPDGIFGTADDRTATTVTAVDGTYLFDHTNTAGFYTGFGDSDRGLLSTGVYRITETQPGAPYNDGADSVGNAAGSAGTVNGLNQGRDGTDLLTGIVLGAGQDATGYNFGERTGVDLVVTKTDGLSSAKTGDLITYSIVVRNVGYQWSSMVIVTDTLPAQLDFISASHGGVFNPGTRQIIWDGTSTPELERLEGDSTEVLTFTITARVRSDLPVGTTTLLNTVTITDDGAYGPDLNPADNTAEDITTVTVPPPPGGGGGVGGGDTVTSKLLKALPEGPFYAYDLFLNPAERFRFFGGSGEIILPIRGIEPLVEPPLTLLPVFSGRVEPGSTVVLEIYNDRGEVIGSQTVVADAGGNWLTTFSSTIIRDNPHEVRMRQTSPFGVTGGGYGFNFRTYFAPAINTGLFTFEPLTIGKVMDRRLPGTILLMQKADSGILILDGWAGHEYEYHCAPGLPSGN